jgi:phenol hydroxylase P3 protein
MLGGLFPDLEFYGIRPPRHMEQAIAEKDYVSHQVYWVLYNFTHAAPFHTTVPPDAELDWLSASYPDTFDRYYRPLWAKARAMEEAGNRFYNMGLPQLCQICQIPMAFTEVSDPAKICFRTSEYEGELYNFCSDGCQWIFDREPEKYVQAWLPAHQIYQGSCGGATMPEVLAWWGIQEGDNLDFNVSSDKASWELWHGNGAGGGR